MKVHAVQRWPACAALVALIWLIWAFGTDRTLKTVGRRPVRRILSPHDAGSTGGAYRGAQHWQPNATIAVETLAESTFARCQRHTVRTESGGLVDDWLWFDERDHVNVLVRTAADGLFVVWRQRKYGLRRETLAPIGGFIERAESPLEAAQRELAEELGMSAPARGWRLLGTFASSDNRGGGTATLFFADGAEPAANLLARKPSLDYEAQSSVRLSRRELLDALSAGAFQEVKWTATVALTLLSLAEGDAGGHT